MKRSELTKLVLKNQILQKPCSHCKKTMYCFQTIALCRSCWDKTHGKNNYDELGQSAREVEIED